MGIHEVHKLEPFFSFNIDESEAVAGMSQESP